MAREKLDRVKEENEGLVREKKRVETPEFVEEVARNVLGMSKPGETIVVLPENLSADENREVRDSTPNWQKWLRLFF